MTGEPRQPGSIPVRVRCGCPSPWVPHHVSRDLVALLSAARVAPDFPVTQAFCRRCKQKPWVTAGDLPLIRSAA